MKKIQLTDTHKEKLFQIPLFRDLPLNIKESLLEKLDFVVYAADKKEIVVTQGVFVKIRTKWGKSLKPTVKQISDTCFCECLRSSQAVFKRYWVTYCEKVIPLQRLK